MDYWPGPFWITKGITVNTTLMNVPEGESRDKSHCEQIYQHNGLILSQLHCCQLELGRNPLQLYGII